MRASLPSLDAGNRAMLGFGAQHPDRLLLFTYEQLSRDPAPPVAQLFRYLGVSDEPALVEACIAGTAFGVQVARAGGSGQPVGDGAFLRKGVVGDWTATLTPEMNELVLQTCGWMFPMFGWTP